jgi:hypothetical protein
MSLEKSITMPSGAICSHHQITAAGIDAEAQTATLAVSSWLTCLIYAEGFIAPERVQEYDIGPEDFSEALEAEYGQETYLLTLAEYAGARRS